MKNLVLITSILFAPTATATVKKPVALVLSTSVKKFNLPTIKFYQAVLVSLQSSSQWKMVPNKETKRYMRQPKGKIAITTIPTISRRSFIRAHPSAKSTKRVRSKNKIEPNIQRMLDTLALQGAVIVDCIPKSKKSVKSCGIFYYDRSAGKVVASNRKNFRVGVSNPSRWSDQLVAGLYDGLAYHKSATSKKELELLLSKSSKNEEQSAKFGVSMSATGESIKSPSPNQKISPVGSLGLYSVKDQTLVGIEAGYGQSIAKDDTAKWNYLSRRVGLQIGVFANSLTSLVWGLTWAVGLSERTLFLDSADSDKDGNLISREGYVSFRPSMMWNVGNGFQLGTNISATKFLGGNQSASGELTKGKFNDNNIGIGFGIRKIF